MIPFQYSTKKKKVPAKRKNSMKEKASKEGKARWEGKMAAPPLRALPDGEGGPPKEVGEVLRHLTLGVDFAVQNLIRRSHYPPCLPLEGKGDRRRRWMRWDVTLRVY